MSFSVGKGVNYVGYHCRLLNVVSVRVVYFILTRPGSFFEATYVKCYIITVLLNSSFRLMLIICNVSNWFQIVGNFDLIYFNHNISVKFIINAYIVMYPNNFKVF